MHISCADEMNGCSEVETIRIVFFLRTVFSSEFDESEDIGRIVVWEC